MFQPRTIAGQPIPGRVGLVVQFSSDPAVTHNLCVEFDDSQITGYEVLNRSGLDIVLSGDPGAGAVVCAIEEGV
jgi:hypothetical protein